MFSFTKIIQADCAKLLASMIDLDEVTNIYIVDRHQKVLHWGKAMVELLGIQKEDAVGQLCLLNLRIEEEMSDQALLISLPNKDGSFFDASLYTQILHDNDKAFSGGIGFLRVKNTPVSKKMPHEMRGELSLNFHGILSRSPTMHPVFQLIENAATTEVTVLVRGESGSGKELVAKAIHDLSPRSQSPFLAINCAALSSHLLESELFGHVRGAFTGAIKDHSGLFQRANGGTLFLDEVAELPLGLQAKLLRVLQERNYIPVGGDKIFDVDVRIVAATHRSLREEVKLGHFREDLMYRLRVVPIFIPPLRERREDIHLLLWHFIHQHSHDDTRYIDKIDPQAMRVLMDYQWPGNIRELQNVVEYAFVVSQGSTITLVDLPPEFREVEGEAPVFQSHVMISSKDEESMIREALAQCHGKITPAAKLLQMSRATFWRKRKIYNI